MNENMKREGGFGPRGSISERVRELRTMRAESRARVAAAHDAPGSAIEIRIEGSGWVAQHKGPLGLSTKALFGTDTIPLPFLAETRASDVLDTLRRLNPNTPVSLKGAGVDAKHEDALTELFGEPISVYSQAQALEDGALVELPLATLVEAGIRSRVVVTRAVWSLFIEWGDEQRKRYPGKCQDQAGRLWDVVWMLRNAMRSAREGQRQVSFGLNVIDAGDGRRRSVKLNAVMGCGDDGAPCVTVMLPGED